MTITALSIDFGNTNTVVAFEIDSQRIELLHIPSISTQGKLASFDDVDSIMTSIPSEIFSQESIKIGKQAYRAVDALRTASAYEFFGANFKHELINAFRVGQNYRPDYQIAFENTNSFLQELCAYILNELTNNYSHTGPIPDVIISAPVSAPLEYINFVRTVVSSAIDCTFLKVIDEATCAAKYFDTLEQGDNILVIDIGGSTTDLSLVEVNGSTAGQPTSILLARNGLRFGGVDIDYLIAYYIVEVNGLGEFDDHSIKTRIRILKIAEAAKKHLTDNPRFFDNLYDPDLATDISIDISQESLESLIDNSSFPSKLSNFFSASRLLIEGAGVSVDSIKYWIFVGGTTLQPSVNKTLLTALKNCGLTVPDYVRFLGQEVFSSVAIGAIHASKVKMIGQELLNSICLKMDDIYKPIFRKGQTVPATSREFALGMQYQGQTHLKFRLAELDNFSEVVEGSSSYRPITCNGETYRMQIPPDTVHGDYRFITRFFVNEEIRIFASINDKHTGEVLHNKIEIGNMTEIGLLSDEDIVSPPFIPLGRESLFSLGSRNQQESHTRILHTRPENSFEKEVQDEIMSWSFKSWLLTGAQIPGTKFKPDHILILESGAVMIVEDKMKYGVWTGAINGSWKCNGELIDCGTTRGVPDENPLKQVQKYRWPIKNIMKNIGIREPFVVETVVAPSTADISSIDLGWHELVKLDSLIEIAQWADRKVRQKLEESSTALPVLNSSTLRSAFHISL